MNSIEENAPQDSGTKIKLNIFDLIKVNKAFRCCHLGIYHSSVVIDEKSEYYFGFAAYHFTGIDSPERINHLPSVMDGEFYMSVDMGISPYSYNQCQDIVKTFKGEDRWLSDSYNFLFHNCNTFTYELCDRLLNHQFMDRYPKWLTRGENIGKFIYITSVAYVLDLKKIRIPSLGQVPQIKVEKVPERESVYEVPEQDENAKI